MAMTPESVPEPLIKVEWRKEGGKVGGKKKVRRTSWLFVLQVLLH